MFLEISGSFGICKDIYESMMLVCCYCMASIPIVVRRLFEDFGSPPPDARALSRAEAALLSRITTILMDARDRDVEVEEEEDDIGDPDFVPDTPFPIDDNYAPAPPDFVRFGENLVPMQTVSLTLCNLSVLLFNF